MISDSNPPETMGEPEPEPEPSVDAVAAGAVAEKVVKTKKKGPGRPRKRTAADPLEMRGVLQEPLDADDIVEVLYHNPLLFKRLILIYKAFGAGLLDMYFDENGLQISAPDHFNKTMVYTTISGSSLNSYWCAQPIRINVLLANLERIFAGMNKNHYRIMFVIKRTYSNKLFISVKDVDYNNDSIYDIDVDLKQPDKAEVPDGANYSLRFALKSDHLKNTIMGIASISKTLMIQKIGETLQIAAPKSQRGAARTDVYTDFLKIGLVSTLEPDEMLSVSVAIEHIRPLSNRNLGDTVGIAVDKTGEIVFTSSIDTRADGNPVATVTVKTRMIR